MTIRTRPACIAALLLAAAAPAIPALADIELASLTHHAAGRLNGAVEWQPFISYGNPDAPGATVMAGATMNLVGIVQGHVFELTGDLPTFAALASNGANDAMHIGLFVTDGVGFNAATTEVSLLQDATLHVPGIGAPDFAAYTITRIEIIGSSFSSGPDGIAFETSTLFTIYGVPAPGAATLLLALAIPATRRRRCEAGC